MTGFHSTSKMSDIWPVLTSSFSPPRSLLGNRNWLNSCQPSPMLQRSSAQKWSSCCFEVLFDVCLAYGLIRYFSQQSNPDLHVLNNQKTSKTIECQIRGRHINECLNTSNLLSGFPSCHVPNSTMDFLHSEIWKRRTSCTFACCSWSCFLVSPESWILTSWAGLE